VRECVAKAIAEAARSGGVEVDVHAVLSALQEPPRQEFGDLALPLPRVSKDLLPICSSIASKLRSAGSPCVERAECVGSYLNVVLRSSYIAELLVKALATARGDYGVLAVRRGRPLRVVVEFVSANPVHPLHIGSGRNAALGDFIARAHELFGDYVERRYYVNDLGLQVSYLLYGYIKLGRPEAPPSMKVDHFLGLVYAATSTVAELHKLRQELERSSGDVESIKRRMEELAGDLLRIRSRVPEVVDKLLNSITPGEDPEEEVRRLSQAIERGDPEVVEVHREVVGKVVSGIRDTLRRLGVEFDRWDYESDLVYSGLVDEVLKRARSSRFFTEYKGAPALDLRALAKDETVRRELSLPKSLEIPPLVIARSDGTTLYTTRDIAYTLKKFSESGADVVYNVIAIEQTLPQAQLRLALYALGFTREARSLVHYAYEMVNVRGMSMSGRRGRYVTVDEVLDALISKAYELSASRGVQISEEVALKIARSAFKYIMLSVSPRKTLTFDLEQAVNVRSGSATYLQYTYARANGLLSKYGGEPPFEDVDTEGLVDKRRELALLLLKFPEVLRKVVEELTPEDLITYLNKLAEVFNQWYDSDPVLSEPNTRLRNLKVVLTYGTKVVLENSFKLLGLDTVERI
jgi:arginyl-tRNA synthetase